MANRLQQSPRSQFWQPLNRHWPGLSAAALLVTLMAAVGITYRTTAQPSPPSIDPAFADLPYLTGEATVELIVDGESIILEIKGDEAPITAGNFVDLVDQGFYDGISFHRVVRQPEPFVAQAGDPQSLDPSVPEDMLGTGGYRDPVTGIERTIPLEILPRDAAAPLYNTTFQMAGLNSRPILSHKAGAVAMARAQPVDSASSQFYITLAAQPFLDGNYAVFGFVTDGMDVVDEIGQGDRIEAATVVEGLDNLVRPDTDMAPLETPATEPDSPDLDSPETDSLEVDSLEVDSPETDPTDTPTD